MLEIGTLIIRLIAVIIVMVFSYIILPPLAEWLKDKRLYAYVQQFVQAAEKLAASGQISKAQKKAYVIKRLQEIGISTDETIDALIESAVEELDWMTGEIIGELTAFEPEGANEKTAFDTSPEVEAPD